MPNNLVMPQQQSAPTPFMDVGGGDGTSSWHTPSASNKPVTPPLGAGDSFKIMIPKQIGGGATITALNTENVQETKVWKILSLFLINPVRDILKLTNVNREFILIALGKHPVFKRGEPSWEYHNFSFEI